MARAGAPLPDETALYGFPLVPLAPLVPERIETIDPHDLRRAMADLADLWLIALRRNQEAVQHRGSLTYTVLTFCRMLYTLTRGTVTSKPRAARWAQHAHDGRWSPLIERALTWRKDPAPQEPVSEEERCDTLAFLDYIVEQCRTFGQSPTWPEPC